MPQRQVTGKATCTTPYRKTKGCLILQQISGKDTVRRVFFCAVLSGSSPYFQSSHDLSTTFYTTCGKQKLLFFRCFSAIGYNHYTIRRNATAERCGKFEFRHPVVTSFPHCVENRVEKLGKYSAKPAPYRKNPRNFAEKTPWKCGKGISPQLWETLILQSDASAIFGVYGRIHADMLSEK